MKINCLGCGHAFDLSDAYDDYEGLVRCNTCAEMLMIRTEDARVRSVLPADMARQLAAPRAPERSPAAAILQTPSVSAPQASASSALGGASSFIDPRQAA
jgi:hypothetical protein